MGRADASDYCQSRKAIDASRALRTLITRISRLACYPDKLTNGERDDIIELAMLATIAPDEQVAIEGIRMFITMDHESSDMTY